MFARHTLPVWVAIILVASMYLMGQGWSPETGPPAPVPKTGQTTSYATGDDGEFEKGVAWPEPRFTDNGNGTVSDNLTGLIWTQNLNCAGQQLWINALDYCNGLGDGLCGLTDESSIGHWRLPNIRELLSLIDYKNDYPALPTGHPFTGIGDNRWTSTTYYNATNWAWTVNFNDGGLILRRKPDCDPCAYVACVRDGQ